MLPFLDVEKVNPQKPYCSRFTSLRLDQTLREVRILLDICYANDPRRRQMTLTMSQLQLCNGTAAARLFLQLDRECQFFVRFALEIYGLQLVVGKT